MQLLAKAGYVGYLFCRPDAHHLALPADDFVWVGYDGSSVLAHRASFHYNSEQGRARDKVERWLRTHTNDDDGVLLWGVGFALVVSALFALFGPVLINLMTTSEDVRRYARAFLVFVILAPLPGVFAFGFYGIYVGATWAREMRNLMLASLAIFLASWWALNGFGNTGLWIALLGF